MSKLSKIKSCLKEDPTLLDLRESYPRYNGLLHVIFGAMCKTLYFSHRLHPWVPTDDENIVKVIHGRRALSLFGPHIDVNHKFCETFFGDQP
jgi:hypothetical protein